MRIAAAVAPVLVLALSLAACSTSSKTTTPATTTSLAATSAAESASTSTTQPAAAGSSSSVGTTSATTSTSAPSSRAVEMNACSLMTTTQLAGIVGGKFTAAKSSTIAQGQDQCEYKGAVLGVTVIVYQPTSGVGYASLIDISGADKPVAGVGDKAAVGAIELDVQAGTRLIAIQNAGGTSVVEGGYTKAVKVAKLLVSALG